MAAGRVDARVHSSEFSASHFKETLLDVRVWLYAAIYLTMVNTLYAVVFFLPAIIEDLGHSPIVSNLLTVPVYAVTAISTVAIAYHSDRRRERPLHIVFSAVITSVGLILLSVMLEVGQSGLAYVACFIAAAGSFPSVILTLTWLTNTIDASSTSAATSTALVVSIGNLGGFFIPQLLGYTKTRTGSYGYALMAMTAVQVIGIALILLLRRITRKGASPTSSLSAKRDTSTLQQDDEIALVVQPEDPGDDQRNPSEPLRNEDGDE